MPTKASITTRTGKGSPLTTAEMDNNLTNLRDQSIAIADDTSTAIDVESGNTLTIAGSGTVSTAAAGQTLTITGTGITATSTDTLENKTIDTANNTITIAEADISDLGAYITASSTDTLTNKSGNISQFTNDSGYLTSFTETNDLSSAVTWANVPDANITQSSVTQHQAALSITESQISDLGSYITEVSSDTTPQLGGDLDVNGNDIVSVSNGNIVLAPNGTGKTKINNINYSEAAPHTVTYAATITPDVANGNIQKVTLTGNVTFSAFSNPVAGQTLTLFVVQDATGSRLLTSTMLFAGGSKTLSTAANAVDIITVHYDGTNYYANLATNFS